MSCSQQQQQRSEQHPPQQQENLSEENLPVFSGAERPAPGQLERSLIQAGLTDVSALDSSIVVRLKYSTEDNFLGKDVYGDLCRAYLQPDVAEMLVKAQRDLRKEHTGYSLIIFDAARPLSVQQKMWDAVDKPVHEKVKFLSNPKYGSLHNYGAAVDVGIADERGDELDMGTPFDFMGEEAYPVLEQQMMSQGRLTAAQVENRRLLRKVMTGAGFFNIQTEWWHFNACYRKEAKEKYELIY